jgi:predicted 3-demethylubiquinone-9 3-methyltransferase (glyoxalase superfamily)
MHKITPCLWLNDNAEDAAEFYLSVFPQAKKLGELRSNGVGPWPAGKIATITVELMGQQMIFLNGGPAHALTPAFSHSIACKDQAEIESYWDKLLEGGKPMACGWLTRLSLKSIVSCRRAAIQRLHCRASIARPSDGH